MRVRVHSLSLSPICGSEDALFAFALEEVKVRTVQLCQNLLSPRNASADVRLSNKQMVTALKVDELNLPTVVRFHRLHRAMPDVGLSRLLPPCIGRYLSIVDRNLH